MERNVESMKSNMDKKERMQAMRITVSKARGWGPPAVTKWWLELGGGGR